MSNLKIIIIISFITIFLVGCCPLCGNIKDIFPLKFFINNSGIKSSDYITKVNDFQISAQKVLAKQTENNVIRNELINNNLKPEKFQEIINNNLIKSTTNKEKAVSSSLPNMLSKVSKLQETTYKILSEQESGNISVENLQKLQKDLLGNQEELRNVYNDIKQSDIYQQLEQSNDPFVQKILEQQNISEELLKQQSQFLEMTE